MMKNLTINYIHLSKLLVIEKNEKNTICARILISNLIFKIIITA